jgi:bifunctional DNA-binding transcriptional regulator/antitoxin component of YhaV-PrlF toxin-antitoxin module
MTVTAAAAGTYAPRSQDSKTGRVWEIADEITRETGRRAERKAVLARYRAEGGNENTGSTQYHLWKAEHQRRHPAGPGPAESRDIPPQRLNVAPDGRIVIPAAMRAAMHLGPDGVVMAEVVDGELRLVTPATAIRRIQDIAARYKRPEESVVDEFLAERRAMWGEE